MVNIRVLLALFLFVLVVVLGCQAKSPGMAPTAQVVKEIEKPADKIQIAEKEIKPAQNQKIETTPKETSSKFYRLEQLEEDIKEIANITYNFTRNPTHPDYVRSSHMDYYVIHTTSNKEKFVDTVEDFCKKYCAANWDGWQYYINMSNYKSLFPLLNRNDFPTEEKYKEYLRDATYVNYTFIETSYDLEHGKVLEYQLISWKLDNSLKYFEGARDGTFLIYKIYCSPNITIMIMPRWEVYKILLPSMTLEDTYRTWNFYIISIREEFLNKSNELLKRCSVNKEFFGNYKFPGYYKSELLTGYWKVYYNRYFNLSSSLEISAEPKGSSKYILNQINVSYTNEDDVELYNAYDYYGDEGVGLRITIISDGQRELEYYKNDKIIGSLEPGKSIKRNFGHFEIEFYDNVTVRAALYVEENVELKPIEKTLSKKDIIKNNQFPPITALLMSSLHWHSM